MRLALIADTFPPMTNSGAVQLRDLAREFVQQGHDITVMVPEPLTSGLWGLENDDGVSVLRLKVPKTKNMGHASRALAELIMPFAMMRALRNSPVAQTRWDGVIWYSPSIFHGPLVSRLKKASGCRSYLVIRDIFPEWAVDMGLLSRGFAYHFFRLVARYQYRVADAIGVQSRGNKQYFSDWERRPGRRLEVLQNWLGSPGQQKCAIETENTVLAGRRLFVYAGNMGVAQGMEIFIDLANRLRSRSDIGFLFVGRGSEVIRLKQKSDELNLNNVLFYDEIHPDQIPDLYRQCTAGIVALDPRHKSHNIPGKFLTYMQSGLPVLANVNAGNDLAEIIRTEKVGAVTEHNNLEELGRLAEQLLESSSEDAQLGERCKELFERFYSVDSAVKQISSSLSQEIHH